jgi:hypothetical protein
MKIMKISENENEKKAMKAAAMCESASINGNGQWRESGEMAISMKAINVSNQ